MCAYEEFGDWPAPRVGWQCLGRLALLESAGFPESTLEEIVGLRAQLWAAVEDGVARARMEWEDLCDASACIDPADTSALSPRGLGEQDSLVREVVRAAPRLSLRLRLLCPAQLVAVFQFLYLSPPPPGAGFVLAVREAVDSAWAFMRPYGADAPWEAVVEELRRTLSPQESE